MLLLLKLFDCVLQFLVSVGQPLYYSFVLEHVLLDLVQLLSQLLAFLLVQFYLLRLAQHKFERRRFALFQLFYLVLHFANFFSVRL